MADKQLFAPVPLRAMAMDLSGLQLRVLICVAAHDRLSLVTGKGQGCRASNLRMQGMIGCHFSRLCSALSQLCELELLGREKLGRHTVYRVVYTDDDRLLFSNALSGTAKDPENGSLSEGKSDSIGCQTASDDLAIGCRDLADFPGFPPETASQYIPLNGVRDSVETGEENPSEDARFAARRMIENLSAKLKPEREKSRLKAGRSRMAHADNVGGQLARLQRALTAGDQIDSLAWYEWLGENAICHENPSLNGQALRLAEDLVCSMSPEDSAIWEERYGPASLDAAA